MPKLALSYSLSFLFLRDRCQRHVIVPTSIDIYHYDVHCAVRTQSGGYLFLLFSRSAVPQRGLN